MTDPLTHDVTQAREPSEGPDQPYAGTVGAAIARATREMHAAGVEDARLDAELLLAYVLAWERSTEDIAFRLRMRTHRLEALREERVRLLTHPEAPLSEWGQRFGMFVRERAAGRPVAYWLEAVEFMGLQFYVNRHVLIPRPETEILVEAALQSLANVPDPQVLDVGSGSGCIGLSLAAFRPDAEVWGVDISPQALRVTRKNAEWLKVRDRFHWQNLDFTTVDSQADPPFRDATGAPAPKFDAIVSNPPYISYDELATLPRETLREPAAALVTGDNGFAIINALLEKGRALLAPEGRIFIEIGHTQGDEAVRRAKCEGWLDARLVPDLAGIPRVLAAVAA